MTAFYQTTPSPECMRIIREGFTPGLSQDGPGVDTRMIEMLPAMVEAGAYALYHSGNIVFALRRHSAWVGIVDMFLGEGATIHDATKAARKFLEWAASHTYYIKLEARSPSPAMAVLAKRVGASIEGYRVGSFIREDGTQDNEVEVGIMLKRGITCHKSH
jgi:hypothetical protein